ncbi:MAG: cobalamin-binding protein [Elusimicrobia bacterium]|nr:cobalamin-binding protein [Elusimicrobiota bacterium]
MRVVSLIASSTEIVCALGFGDHLVGRSHECDYPASVRGLPVLTEAKINAAASSRSIDEQVKTLLKDAVSIYRVDGERLKALTPDVIVTQTQCEVCAVSLKDVEAAIGRELGVSAKVVALEPNALEDVFSDIRKVADALGAEAAGEGLIHRLRARMKAVADRARDLPRTRVACVEWLDPLMAAGNWMPELVALAGGENLFGEAGKHSPQMTFEALAAADPDVIVALPCGFDLARTRLETQALLGRPGWEKLRAVRERRVYAVDGNQFFNRPGPRLAESLEILAAILHPDELGREVHDGMERL